MALCPRGRKEHWKAVFRNAWDTIKEDDDKVGDSVAEEEGHNGELGKEADLIHSIAVGKGTAMRKEHSGKRACREQ